MIKYIKDSERLNNETITIQNDVTNEEEESK